MPDSRRVTFAQTQHGLRQKADPAWRRGIWVGKDWQSDEHLVGTPTGVVTCRSVRRLEPRDQADVKLLEEM